MAVVLVTVCSQYDDPVARVQPVLAVSARSSSGRDVHFGAVHEETFPARSFARTDTQIESPWARAGECTAVTVRSLQPEGSLHVVDVPSAWASQYAAWYR